MPLHTVSCSPAEKNYVRGITLFEAFLNRSSVAYSGLILLNISGSVDQGALRCKKLDFVGRCFPRHSTDRPPTPKKHTPGSSVAMLRAASCYRPGLFSLRIFRVKRHEILIRVIAGWLPRLFLSGQIVMGGAPGRRAFSRTLISGRQFPCPSKAADPRPR